MFTPTGIISSPFPITEITPTEEWACKPPVRGDHIRVSRGMYNHHGIYIADGEVIHFSSENDDNILGSDNRVLRTDISSFLRDGRVEVKIYTDEEFKSLYSVEDIVSWARHCLGDDGYNLAFNNCQHFANFCTLGQHRSQQVENILGGGKKMGLLGTIGGWIGGLFGGGSSSRDSTTTTYEPDKVRVAEIEADCKLRLAGKEQERIILYTEKQMELLEFNTRMEAAVIAARVRGEQELQKSMLEIMREVNVIAEQRIKLIEIAHLDIIKQVEGYYKELDDEIVSDDFILMDRKKQLLHTVKEFENGSVEQDFYMSEIRELCKRHNDFITERMKSLHVRQSQVLASCIASKEQIGMSLQVRQQAALPHGHEMPQIGQQLQITDENADKLGSSAAEPANLTG